MSFRINTNITAMNAHNYARKNDNALNMSLSHLSSGLRVEKAADDASGMTIADSLRAQASSLGQAVANANDAIGIVQTADNAMDEQLNILNTVRTKAIQAAQDGQNTDSRKALQADINRLLEELDNIATTTSFNGQQLLNGNFSNKNFQIGAYSNETVQVSIGATESTKIGHTRFETSAPIGYKLSTVSAITTGTIKLDGIEGMPGGYVFQEVTAEELKEKGLKAIADRLNGVSDITGVKANVNNTVTFSAVVGAQTKAGDPIRIKGLTINGAKIGDLDLKNGDSDAVLANAINSVKSQTGVEASVKDGKLTLTARDGRAINITAYSGISNIGADKTLIPEGATMSGMSMGASIMGRLTLSRQDARDIVISMGFKDGSTLQTKANTAGLSTGLLNSNAATATITLHDMNTGVMDVNVASAIGAFAPETGALRADQPAGVITYAGAQAMINVSESAQKQLDRIRSDIGSVQNQLIATINNITVTQVNVKGSESQIRDVDFAVEASNFNKYNILAQSGSYAMSQANTVQQNVTRLLQ